MIKPSEYKNYSLENLREWINDSLESEATVDEIYLTIVNTVKERNKYHKSCLNAGEELLRKLNVATPPHPSRIGNVKAIQQFWEDEDITGEDC